MREIGYNANSTGVEHTNEHTLLKLVPGSWCSCVHPLCLHCVDACGVQSVHVRGFHEAIHRILLPHLHGSKVYAPLPVKCHECMCPLFCLSPLPLSNNCTPIPAQRCPLKHGLPRSSKPYSPFGGRDREAILTAVASHERLKDNKAELNKFQYTPDELQQYLYEHGVAPADYLENYLHPM